ncbi:hypothetical protein BQ8482_111806 [Mesorhizobium delmotii]|uniref:Uncharacterized protein n=1 Tax=Mesorhizobium delmotii TaxID=1631247 RepID=A0A2P9AFH2_9HYPH|nr:hypothetical protein BQ8482_111806 [Mesorhizobium delmotii]
MLGRHKQALPTVGGGLAINYSLKSRGTPGNQALPEQALAPRYMLFRNSMMARRSSALLKR